MYFQAFALHPLSWSHAMPDKQRGLTPLSLAVPPSAVIPSNAVRLPYSQQRQYAADAQQLLDHALVAGNTRTFDFMGKPYDSDQDRGSSSTQTFDFSGKPYDHDSD
jgi:hypothetical protein